MSRVAVELVSVVAVVVVVVRGVAQSAAHTSAVVGVAAERQGPVPSARLASVPADALNPRAAQAAGESPLSR